MLLAGKFFNLHLEHAGGGQHFRLEAPLGSHGMDGVGLGGGLGFPWGLFRMLEVGGWICVVMSHRLVHEGLQGSQLFGLFRDDGGPASSHDALEMAGVVAGHLTAGKPVLPVQLKAYHGTGLQQLVLPSGLGPVEIEGAASFRGHKAKVQRHNVDLPLVAKSQPAAVAAPDDFVNLLLVGDFPVLPSHGFPVLEII